MIVSLNRYKKGRTLLCNKSKSTPFYFKISYKKDFCFDIASRNEMDTILKLGGKPEKMIIKTNDALLKKIPLEILDIGGGFPITHFDNETDLFPSMAEKISVELDEIVFVENIGANLTLHRRTL